MQPVPFDILAVDHIVLRSSDAPRLVRFYVEGFGCSVVWDRPDLGLTHLSAGDALIDIVDLNGPRAKNGVSSATGPGHSIDHFCFRIVPFDFNQLKVHFHRFDIEIAPPIERFGAKGYGRSIYLNDPDGNGLEIKEENVVGEATSI